MNRHYATDLDAAFPYRTREIMTYHRMEDGTVRAVVVRWERDGYTRVGQTRRVYTARSLRGVWLALYVGGHIPRETYGDGDALRTFAMLGRVG